MQQTKEEKCDKQTISDAAVTLKKMRDLKGLTRKQAGIIFNLTHKTIEKLENGRGLIDEQRLAMFEHGYGLQLLAQTVTSEDRQKVAYANYTKKHKNIGCGDFLELIQYGEVQINDYLPDEMKRQKKMNNVSKLGIS